MEGGSQSTLQMFVGKTAPPYMSLHIHQVSFSNTPLRGVMGSIVVHIFCT